MVACGSQREDPAWFEDESSPVVDSNDPWYVPATTTNVTSPNDQPTPAPRRATTGVASVGTASPAKNTSASTPTPMPQALPSRQNGASGIDDYTMQLEKEIARLAAENQRLRRVPTGTGSGHLAAGPSFAVVGTGSGSLLERLAELEIELRRQESDLESYRDKLAMAQNQQNETERELRITLGSLDSYRDERTKRMTAIQEMRRAETELAQATLEREAMNIRRLRIERQLYSLMHEIVNADPNEYGALQKLQNTAKEMSIPVTPPDYQAPRDEQDRYSNRALGGSTEAGF
jgi:hypothetical protein